MGLEYLNARVRAWKAQLFNKEGYEKLLSFEDLKPVADSLRSTPYAKDLEIARSRYKGEKEVRIIDEALKGHLTRALSLIWKEGTEDSKRLFRAFIAPWEVYNLKAVLRGLEGHIDSEVVYAQLLPAGDLDKAALKELTHQKGVKAVIQLLTTWGSPYSRPLRKAFPQYQKENSLFGLEIAMDRFLYPSLLDSITGQDTDSIILTEFLRDRVDLANILTLLKLSKEDFLSIPPSIYYISGGRRLKEADFLRLIVNQKGVEKASEGLIEAVRDRNWRDTVKRVPLKDMILLEEELEVIIKSAICRKAVIDPLSVAVPLCYIYNKYREVKNLRLIAMAKEFHIPSHEIKRFIL